MRASSAAIAIMLFLVLIFLFTSLSIPEGPNITVELIQDEDFYQAHYDQTVAYLSAVYPAAAQRFELMGISEIARFYNQLWIYYNCQGAFHAGALAGLNGIDSKDTILCWESTCENGVALPYAPQGTLYSVRAWINSAQSGQNEPWERYEESDSTQPASEFSPSIMGQTFWNRYTGPNSVWFSARCIYRKIYASDGVETDSNNCSTPQIPSLAASWPYPDMWWNGAKYVEVMAMSEPGIANSPPVFWLDGNFGSGVFYETGETHVTRNKCSALLELAGKCDARYLKRTFGEADPISIAIRVLETCNFPPVMVHSKDGPVEYKICEPAGSNNLSVPNSSTGWCNVCHTDPAIFSRWCSKDKRECVRSIARGEPYEAERHAAIEGWDAILFMLAVHLELDSVQMVASANGNGLWQYEIMALRGYPAEAADGDFSAFLEMSTAPAPLADDGCDKLYGAPSAPMGSAVAYRKEFVKENLKTLAKMLSLRDPIDLDISLPCEIKLTEAGNVVCSNNLSVYVGDEILVGQRNNQCRVPKKHPTSLAGKLGS